MSMNRFGALAWAGISLFAVLIALAAAGERLLPLFGGDRELAGRAMKALFSALAGLGFALVQPALWRAFARRTQGLIARGGGRGRLAARVRAPGFLRLVERIGLGLMAAFAAAALGLAGALWAGWAA